MKSYQPPSRVTLRDVAKTLGVSHVTVSLALRNSPKITEARRAAIKARAEEMNYQPNPMAAALAHFKQNSKVVPVSAALAWLNFWPQPEKLRSYAEFDLYWQGAKVYAEKLGFHLEEFICNEKMPVPRIEQILHARGITGILIPPHGSHPIDWGDFHWNDYSVVKFGRSVPQPDVNLVSADQVSNTLLAFDEIRARGYERVGFITGQSASRGMLFQGGFLLAQRFVEPSLRLPILEVDEVNPMLSLQTTRQWFKKEKPDAIFTDIRNLLPLLEKVGCRVPDDVGLAVTSVLDATADSGIYQNPEEIGRVALLSLVSLIHDNDRGVPKISRQILVEGDWVDGKTLPKKV
ncbi:MAG: LacI family DNA-binding transcriptional regulator [Chthoniobacterales bacterium]